MGQSCSARLLVGFAKRGGHAGEHLARELLRRRVDFTVQPVDNASHTVGGANLTGPDFLGRKERITAALRDEIEHGDMERMVRRRAMNVSL